MKYYTGIGSRETPPDIIGKMIGIGLKLNTLGYTLRSGGAEGADSAFELKAGTNKEIYLPWVGFNNNPSKLYYPTNEAFELAKTIHPVWDILTVGGKKLHARNMHQVLGMDLKTPSSFLVCWTKNGTVIGGTASAMKLAKKNNIPIYNLFFLEDYINLTNNILNNGIS